MKFEVWTLSQQGPYEDDDARDQGLTTLKNVRRTAEETGRNTVVGVDYQDHEIAGMVIVIYSQKHDRGMRMVMERDEVRAMIELMNRFVAMEERDHLIHQHGIPMQ